MKTKHHSILKFRILILAGMYLSLFACTNTETDIGDSFFKSNANVVVVDTLTVKMETVYMDSIATSGTGTLLTGNYRDSLCGNSDVSSYMQLGAPTIRSISETAIYDSLCFLLQPNGYVLGDTLQPFNLAVHQLSETITPAENQTNLYNTSTFSYDTNPLGTWSGRIYPSHIDPLSVRLSDVLGQTLFDAIVQHPDKLSSNDLFVYNYLKGVVLTGENNNTIFGFKTGDSSGLMRLYYHNSTDAKTALYTDFKISDTNLQFNHVDNDRSATPFSSLNSSNKIADAASTDYLSVTQPINNLAIRLSFPYLQNLLHLGRYVQIVSAQLTMYPPAYAYSAARPLPSGFKLFSVIDDYSVVNSSGIAGNFVADNLYKNSYYTYDLTNYLVNEIQTDNENYKTKLLLIPEGTAYNTSFDRLILSSQLPDKDGIQMRIQLVMYNME